MAELNSLLRRGPFVVVEGIDGSGKTTIAAALAEKLRALDSGGDVVLTREPTDDGEFGKKIRSLAETGIRLDPWEELQLFLADRRQHVERVIVPSLNNGDCVISDRYLQSTAFYQGLREGGPSVQEILDFHDDWAPEPDVVFILDIPVELALDRIERRGDRTVFENQLLSQIAEQYRTLYGPNIVHIDAQAEISEIVRAMIIEIGARMAQLISEYAFQMGGA